MYSLCGSKITSGKRTLASCKSHIVDCPKLTFTFSSFLTKRQVWWWRFCYKKKILISCQNGSAGGGSSACCIRSAETAAPAPASILSVTTKGWRWPSCTTPAARCMAGLPPRTGRAAAEFMSVTQRLSCLHWNTMANLHQWSFQSSRKSMRTQYTVLQHVGRYLEMGMIFLHLKARWQQVMEYLP